MAFGVQAVYSGGTVSLTDKAPYSLLSARGMAGAPVRRVVSRGPNQEGETDLGYRLQPREVELQIGFLATTDAVLDGYRDTLMSVFKPLASTPVYLRVTRDDGEVRQLDCYTVGGVEVDWVKENRPGHYHVATVRLYAPDAAYYDPAPGTVTVTGSVSFPADWYLAGGAIGSANVLTFGSAPAQGSVWAYSGTVAGGSAWSIAFRSGKETAGASPTYAFYMNNNDAAGQGDVAIWAGSAGGTTNYWTQNDYSGSVALGTDFMAAGTSNYFVIHNATTSGTARDFIRRGKTDYSLPIAWPFPGVSFDRPLAGTAGRWRSNATNTASSRWAATMPLYAVYNIALSESQLRSLDTYMGGDGGAAAGTSYITTGVQYPGDLPEYPVISVRGPITGLIMNNVATGDSIALGTTVIAAGETYVFDLRPGYKTVKLGTVNKRSTLATYSDWDEWNITPDAEQGSNPIIIYGTNTSGSTQVSIVYYERYSSY